MPWPKFSFSVAWEKSGAIAGWPRSLGRDLSNPKNDMAGSDKSSWGQNRNRRAVMSPKRKYIRLSRNFMRCEPIRGRKRNRYIGKYLNQILGSRSGEAVNSVYGQ